jgi:hypothetical protein
MEAIHRNKVLQRIAYVDDTLMASQAQGKDVSSYLKGLAGEAGIRLGKKNDSAAFLAANPGGI